MLTRCSIVIIIVITTGASIPDARLRQELGCVRKQWVEVGHLLLLLNLLLLLIQEALNSPCVHNHFTLIESFIFDHLPGDKGPH